MKDEIVYDQHFMVDPEVIQFIIKEAGLNKKDIVLEIGPGEGYLTEELVKKAGKVIAIEIDEKFIELLEKIPHLKLVFGNALEILPLRNDFNKIVANIPYQICEPLMHYLCSAKKVELSVLTMPMRFARKVQEHPVFSAFLKVEILKEVPKESFSPQPRVYSAVVRIVLNKDESDELFIIRKLYWQRTKKLKNGLRDALIDLAESQSKKLSKKEALGLIEKMGFEDQILEMLIARLPLETYGKIESKIRKKGMFSEENKI